MAEKLHKCPECGLHYADPKIAEQCEAFCKTHHACSFDITQHSTENQKLAAQSKKGRAK